MVNPYHSPALHEPDGGDSRVASASLIALLSFGLLPAAMIFVRMIVAVTYSERDWDWSIWVWAVGPPLYLSASWMFAIHVRRRGTIRLRVLLPIALLPLVGFSIFIGTLTVVYFRATGGYPLTGWFAVDHLLWLVVSLLAPPYFLTTTWSTLRVLWNPNRSDDEPADAHGAAVVGEFDVVNGGATICSGIAFFVDPKDPETLNAASPSPSNVSQTARCQKRRVSGTVGKACSPSSCRPRSKRSVMRNSLSEFIRPD